MYNILHGDCLDLLATLNENSVDSIVTDPPYELGFMGKSWDSTGIAFSPDVWKAALKVLKPGGYILAFSSARTYHRMAVAIEDAGFEIRDQIMWVYGSGFPKSMNIPLAMEKKGLDPTDFVGWGTALKPAHEPIVMARKPLEGTVVDNLLTWGVGGINIDDSRVPGEPVPINKLEEWSGFGQKIEPDYKQEMNTSGRFPANFIHDGSDEVVELFPQAKGGAYPAVRGKSDIGAFAQGGTHKDKPNQARVMGDDGSAARFFYCAKANSKDRNEGLENHKNGQRDLFSGNNNTNADNSINDEDKRKNTHPTVKPTELMRYLIKMVTPAGGTVLDPFAGSGSTGKAAMLDDYKFVGIEMNEEYVAIAKARIEHAILKK